MAGGYPRSSARTGRRNWWRKPRGANPGIEWHFIGHLQTNKVRQVVGRAALIHSVDSVRLAGMIAEEAAGEGLLQPVLLQVNVSGEETKTGMELKDLSEALKNIEYMSGISVRGLMTIAPFTGDRDEIRRVFAKLRDLRDEVRGPGTGIRARTVEHGHDQRFRDSDRGGGRPAPHRDGDIRRKVTEKGRDHDKSGPLPLEYMGIE